MSVHDSRELNQCLAGHDTVGVKNDHIVVILSPPSQEISNITALSPNIIAPVTVKNFSEALDSAVSLKT